MNMQVSSTSSAGFVRPDTSKLSSEMAPELKAKVNKGADLLASVDGDMSKLSKEDKKTVNEGGQLKLRDKQLNDPSLSKEEKQVLLDGMNTADRGKKGEKLSDADKKVVAKSNELLKDKGLQTALPKGMSTKEGSMFDVAAKLKNEDGPKHIKPEFGPKHIKPEFLRETMGLPEELKSKTGKEILREHVTVGEMKNKLDKAPETIPLLGAFGAVGAVGATLSKTIVGSMK